MIIFWISLLFIALAFLGVGIKILFGKSFSGTCASENPNINKDGEPCGFCGKVPDKEHICIKQKLKMATKNYNENKKTK